MESSPKLRRQIASEAARLLCQREEKAFHRAKLVAARRLAGRVPTSAELPTNAEVREQIRLMSWGESASPPVRLDQLRRAALSLMRLGRAFRPRLVGSALDGRFRPGSDIDLELFAASGEEVAQTFAAAGFETRLDSIIVQRCHGVLNLSVVRIDEPYRVRMLVYPTHLARKMRNRRRAGAGRQRASMSELSELLAQTTHAELDAAPATLTRANIDRFDLYASLLAPLEHVAQDRRRHPEGDALYHSLQVFELARARHPYDEEFLLAALLHDVGKAIDTHGHVAAGLEALGESITDRTRWFIEHHLDARAIRAAKGGHRLRRRLEESDDFEELLLLADLDVAGRKTGVPVPDVEDALDYVRRLADACGE